MTSVSKYLSRLDIDEKIEKYIEAINKKTYVATHLSCQGHYCKNIHKSTICYIKKTARDDFACYTTRSRVKFPFVLLQFLTPKWAKAFIRALLRNRWKLHEEIDALLYYLTPKNKPNIFVVSPCFIVCKFDKIYVSVSFLIGKCIGTRYYKNKRKMDAFLDQIRKVFFSTVQQSLDIAENITGHRDQR